MLSPSESHTYCLRLKRKSFYEFLRKAVLPIPRLHPFPTSLTDTHSASVNSLFAFQSMGDLSCSTESVLQIFDFENNQFSTRLASSYRDAAVFRQTTTKFLCVDLLFKPNALQMSESFQVRQVLVRIRCKVLTSRSPDTGAFEARLGQLPAIYLQEVKGGNTSLQCAKETNPPDLTRKQAVMNNVCFLRNHLLLLFADSAALYVICGCFSTCSCAWHSSRHTQTDIGCIYKSRGSARQMTPSVLK